VHFAFEDEGDARRLAAAINEEATVGGGRLAIGQQRCANGSLLRALSALGRFADAFKSAWSVWLGRRGRGIASLFPFALLWPAATGLPVQAAN
jgi:hypothetical protein